VDGAGTSTSSHDYEWPDENPLGGISYYRLKQVNFDGSFNFSNTIVIEMNSVAQISVSPNPTEDQLNLQLFSPDDGAAEIQLSNEMGEMLVKQDEKVVSGSNTFHLSLQMFPAGIYFIKLTGPESISGKVMRIVKK
jgi:hypothetical protein